MSPGHVRRGIGTHPGRDGGLAGCDPLRVIVVHANEVVRTGLATILETLEPPVDVTLCDHVRAAREVIEEADADVVIVSLAAGDGCEGVDMRALCDRATAHGAKVLLLLGSADRETVFEMATMPCDGILVEDGITSADICEAFNRLRRGDMPVPASVLRGLLSEFRSLYGQRTGGTPAGAGGLYLTPREHETLRLLAQGLSNKQIARRLRISEHGVKRHVANILVKLNCPNRTLAAARAIREGLVDPA